MLDLSPRVESGLFALLMAHPLTVHVRRSVLDSLSLLHTATRKAHRGRVLRPVNDES